MNELEKLRHLETRAGYQIPAHEQSVIGSTYYCVDDCPVCDGQNGTRGYRDSAGNLAIEPCSETPARTFGGGIGVALDVLAAAIDLKPELSQEEQEMILELALSASGETQHSDDHQSDDTLPCEGCGYAAGNIKFPEKYGLNNFSPAAIGSISKNMKNRGIDSIILERPKTGGHHPAWGVLMVEGKEYGQKPTGDLFVYHPEYRNGPSKLVSKLSTLQKYWVICS